MPPTTGPCAFNHSAFSFSRRAVMLVPERRSEDGYGRICSLCDRPIVKRRLEPPPLRVEGRWRHALTCESAKPTGRGGLDEILRLTQRRLPGVE